MVGVLDKLTNYAVNFFAKTKMEKWPTVHEMSRGTGISQTVIADHVDNYGPLMTEFYETKHTFGERYVVADTPVVDKMWQDYYSNNS